ncbi:unnamed protein product [Rhizophagus irregularis]|uniref:protein-serine/threonine phosphatase n=1 Tax=Rhizophagus irregularis TaxID=588596 RepID=A0A915ZSX2_9GLOM|nr:unnamed protein product [Rhizophagus irregularis]CAB5215527.1 unnamed protein product [Rhizophagus irregularis]CAB5389059.1 unnamed protein product [Rhizophagus irregularis]
MATRYLNPSMMQSFKSIFIKPLFKSPTIKLAISSVFFNRPSFNSTRSFGSTGAYNSSIVNVTSQIDWNTKFKSINVIEVEAQYDGPKFDDMIITKEFVEDMIDHFKKKKKIHEKYAYQIILTVRKMMLETPTLVDITIPQNSKLTVCGDIHGQFYDFINIFKINGVPSETNMYLFNGDFINRGSFGFEVILALFAYKWLYPKSFYLTRGNHEHITLAKNYGFENEVNTKYSKTMFEYFAETFETLPLANLINKKILVVHGGLSNSDITLDDIKNIYRFKSYVQADSLMEYLLWSDPKEKPGCDIGKRGGIGIGFGPDITENFLKRNNLDLLIRSHEVKKEGYEIEHNGKCITIFSAPDYCGVCGNKGAIINIAPDLKLTYKTFEAVPQPM